MGESLNLLLVEDSETDARLLVYGLTQAGYDVNMQRVQTADEMRDALTQREWDAIISDYRLPTFNAPDALEVLRESGRDLPFLVVSGTIGEETAVEIMRSGAHDYLMKGNLNRLAEALRREIREARVREESRQGEVALRESEGRFRMLFERSNDAIFAVDKKSGRYLDANKAAEKLTGRSIAEIKRLTVFDITPESAKERLDKISSTKETFEFGEVVYTRPDGSARTALLSALPINDEIIFGIAHDITETKLAQQSLERRAREMEALYKNSLEINAQIDLMTLLNTIVKQAAHLLNAPMGGLYLMEPDGETLSLVVPYSLPDRYVGVTLRLGEGLSGRIALTGEPMMVSDYEAWEGRAQIFEQEGFRRVLGAPLKVKGKVIGTIDIADPGVVGPYSLEEVRLLQLIADQAAIAVENTRLFETAQRELTERRQAEIALRESEERYRTVVTGAQVVSFVLDAKGVFTLSEGKSLASLGLKPGQVVGLSALEMYQDYPSIINSIHRALAGETAKSEDHIGEIVFDSTYAPFFDENGNVEGVIGVSIDITERIKSEEQLRESEKSYRGLFNSVDEAIYIQDEQGRFLDANQGALDLYGYSREHFIGKTPEALGAPGMNNFDLIRQAHQRAFDGELQAFEFWGRRKNGEVFPKDVRLYKGTYFGQEVVIALAQDITERKRAEQALRRQLKELTTLHAIAGMAIRARSIDELVEFVTQEVGRIFYSDNFGFGFLDETEKSLRPHPSYQGLTANVPRLYPIEGSVSGSVIVSGKPRRVSDVTKASDYLMVNPDVRSELCVPIKLGERVIGIINAESKQQDFFTDDDERLMLTIAGQMANAIERFRLFEAESNRRREAETLREAISALSTSLELEKVLEIIMNSIEQVVPFDSASIFLLEGDQLRIMMARGLPNLDKIINQTFPADDGLFSETLRNGHLLILEDAQNDPRFNQWGETSYVRGWMAVPLIARGEVIGYITLDSRKPAAYTQEQATLAQAFANQAAIAIQNARLFEGIQNSLRELNQAYETTIEGWSRALDLRDRETEGHTLRVTDLTIKMAGAMGFSEEERMHIRRGALLHDMGKLGVPDRILLKPDSLNDEEWEIMRMHPLYTYQMLAPIEYLRPALDIPFSHHERWDGSGYPRGLKGEEIPLVARIFAVIDVWDALTSDRPYRPAWNQKATLEYLKKNAGILFDPEVVKIFLSLWQEGKIS
jgi:PAS domain S-box-containing protein